MADPKLLEQAKQGNAIALKTLLNKSLRPHGIWARIDRDGSVLQIALESTEAPDAEAMEKRIRSGIKRLQPQGVDQVVLSGWALGEVEPTWERELPFASGPAIADLNQPIHEPGTPEADLNSIQDEATSDIPDLLSNPAESEPLSPRLVSQSSATPRSRPPERTRSPQPQPLAGLRPPQRNSKKPFVLKWSDFDPMMLAIVGFVAIYGLMGARNPDYDGPFIWLHFPNLAIHETGHLLFMPFGHFLMVLGGSLTQIAFPAVCTGYFFYSQQYFSTVLTLFWTGQNFMDVAVYMADAPYRALPLTNPNIDAHDWWQLFNLMNCMNHAELIAGITHWIGVFIYLASIAGGVYVAYHHKQTMDAKQRV